MQQQIVSDKKDAFHLNQNNLNQQNRNLHLKNYFSLHLYLHCFFLLEEHQVFTGVQPSCCDYYNKTPYTVTPYTIAGFILFHRRVCSICTNLHHLACVYSLKLLFIKWFVYLPRVCSALPGFKAGLIPACPLPHPELGPWLSSGCFLWKAGHNAGGASAPCTSAGLVDVLW